MSYCRWRDGISDVYIYPDIRGDIRCVMCKLMPTADVQLGLELFKEHEWANFDTAKEACDHLLKHREAGHLVPQFAIDALRAEAAEAKLEEKDR